MTKRSFLRWVSVSAIVGFIVPVAYLLGFEIFNYTMNKVWMLIWPSSIFLMATDGSEGTPGAYLIIAESSLANIILYSILGCVLWGISRAIIKARGKIQ
jgi:hypothetical protein